ncbi:MAG TPA: protein kinase, partial [Thermoanaerobaculia bacterium]|nr:protein kinase [Thermoanaerobaculia bacterium]
TRLGPYEIVAPLGAGGMGEVYRAWDTRLGREVAVKVVSPRFAADADQLHRFEQEARAASQLDHPNILVVHDIGSHEGSPYIVSELLDGESLREKLGERLPPKKAVDYAIQVAHGLAAAHEKGIGHRDLKPENVFVTTDGRIKILDFGIAKLTQPAIPSVSLTEAPTAAPPTDAGVILGTVAYMSPEQARGETVDFRSDQFSLGIVLYEVLTGKRPFGGASAAETLAAIIREEPEPVTKLEPRLPAPLGWIVQRCLSKDPEERYSSTRDLAKELQNLRMHLSEAVSATAPAEVPRLRRRIPLWTLAAGAALAGALGLLLGSRFLRPGSPPALPLNLSLPFPVDAAPDARYANPFALTPDGKTLVYAGSSGGNSVLYVRRLDRDEIRPIPGTDGASMPFISPDGLEVGFFADKKLKKASLSGGSPMTLCEVQTYCGGSWGMDGTIVFAPCVSSLRRIPASGGEPRPVTIPGASNAADTFYPQILPDGEHVLVNLFGLDRKSRAAVVSLRTGEQRILLEDAAYPRFLPTGHLVFTRPGSLFAVPFSLERLEPSGPPVPLLDDLVTNFNFNRSAEYAFSEQGTLVYVPSRQFQRTLVWVDRRGAVERVPFPPGSYFEVALSPDGGRFAAIAREKGERMALLLGDFARGTLSRSTAEGDFQGPVWAPDGKRIAFAFGQWGEEPRAYWQGADESTPPEPLTSEMNQEEFPTSFSPDGNVLLLEVFNYADTSSANRRRDILVLPLSGERKLRPFLQTKFSEGDGCFSPDGRWIAYDSNESASWEVFVRPFPGPGAKWQISTEGGREPRWSGSGRELF